jgi:hypothetical protein
MKHKLHYTHDSGEVEEFLVKLCQSFLIHDTVFDGKVNIFLKLGGWLMVDKSDSLAALIAEAKMEKWEKCFTRFNPSPEANDMGIKTPWEEGDSYAVFYDPDCVPHGKLGENNFLYFNGSRMRTTH